MDILIIILLIITIAGVGAMYFYLTSTFKAKDETPLLRQLEALREELQRTQHMQREEVQQRLDRVHDQLSKGLQHSQTSLQEQFRQVNESDAKMRQTIQEITQALTEVRSTNKQVLDFSGQLQQLQNILKNPKQRGVLGEYWLETLLANVLPSKNLYSMQYVVGTSEQNDQKLIADAVIFVSDLIIPIDAKFSLENFNRFMSEQDPQLREKYDKEFKSDVKKRIDETSKYIQPAMGTVDFAFMFIPAEGVYYNLLNADVGSGINSSNLIEYAFQKHVLIVSPTSFYAYLQTVLMGLQRLEIEKSTQHIIKRITELKNHMNSYGEVHGKLGKNLSTVVNQYNQTSQEFTKVSKDLMKITGGDKDDVIEFEAVQKPIDLE